MLDGLLPGTARDLARLGAIPVLASLEEARAWASLTNDTTGAPPAALHIDTGLNRLGMSADRRSSSSRAIQTLLRRLDVALVMSHLACADEADHPMNREQLDTFLRLRASLPPARASLAASDGLMLGPDFHFDLVRPGYALYGGQAARERTTPVAPVVRVSARILQVQDVAPGRPHRLLGELSGEDAAPHRHDRGRICRRRVPPRERAATPRPAARSRFAASSRPIVGRVSMDLITVDVTDSRDRRRERGDWADLVGPELPIEAVGAAAGTIGYEVLTRLGTRFHRVYLDRGD